MHDNIIIQTKSNYMKHMESLEWIMNTLVQLLIWHAYNNMNAQLWHGVSKLHLGIITINSKFEKKGGLYEATRSSTRSNPRHLIT